VDTVFRPMTLADVPFVGELEPLCFPAPWSPDTYRKELLHNRFGHYWVLAPEIEAGPEPQPALPPILAYGGYWLMGDEVHIVTIATHPRFRRRGLSERLMLFMIDECRSRGAAYVTLEVRAGNRAAQQLYAKLGFVEAGVRRGYYHDNGEDALLMTLLLQQEAGTPEDPGAG
jgi:[ribosomal protein S18]-alanine N-acetyltransferase